MTDNPIRHTNPPALSTPTGYTHVVEVLRGRTVYIAGQVAFDRSGNVVGAGDFKAQTRQVLENLKAALAAAGATFDRRQASGQHAGSGGATRPAGADDRDRSHRRSAIGVCGTVAAVYDRRRYRTLLYCRRS